MKKANVVSLSAAKDRSFFDVYQVLMREKQNDSKSTHRSYSRTFTEFFKFRFNKDPEQITWDDLRSLTNIDFRDFRDHLLERLIPSTTATSLYHLRWLWKELVPECPEPKLDPFIATVKKPVDTRDQYSLGSDAMSFKEVTLLIEYAKTVDFHPELQALFFEFATVVPLRISALRKIIWDDIKREKDLQTGIEHWVVYKYDKRKTHRHPISDDLYNRLQVLKTILHNGVGFMDKPTDRVFLISEKKIRETLDGFKERYGIEKKISPHSLKKTSVSAVYEKSGDLLEAQRHSQHSSIENLVRYAIGQNLSLVASNMFADREKMYEELRKVSPIDIFNIVVSGDNLKLADAVYGQLIHA